MLFQTAGSVVLRVKQRSPWSVTSTPGALYKQTSLGNNWSEKLCVTRMGCTCQPGLALTVFILAFCPPHFDGKGLPSPSFIPNYCCSSSTESKTFPKRTGSWLGWGQPLGGVSKCWFKDKSSEFLEFPCIEQLYFTVPFDLCPGSSTT